MDLLASRLARDAKSKPKKGVKRLSKNDTKENKKKIASKVDSVAVEKLSKKQKNLQKEVSSKKKDLIKNILQKQESLVKNLIKKNDKDTFAPSQNKVSKPKKVEKSDEKPSAKKVGKKPGKTSKIPDYQVIRSEGEVKTEDTKSKKRQAPLQVKEEVSNSKATKKIKSQPAKPVAVKKTATKTKDVGNSKKSKKVKSQVTKPTLVEKNSVVKTEEVSSNAKSAKKLQSQPTKPVAVENNEEIKNIKSKKRKQPETEEQKSGLNLNKKEVVNFVKALIKVIETEQQKKKTLFDSEKPPILMNVNCFKVPKVPLHQHRIKLPHSMISSTDDIAIFVKDLKRGRKRDPEDTVRHYEDIFQQHGITQIKAIIPINQVKTEYRQFEMRRRLFNSYDHFLVDGRISGHIAHLLGKQFREKRKLPTSIPMERKNLKEVIDSSLKKTCIQIHGHGDSSIIQIGTCSMKVEHIADNILAVVEDLSKNFPGGWENIRSLRIKAPLSLAIPIYVSLKSRNEVEVPVLTPKRPKAYHEVEGELSTYTSNVKVHVAPDGSVRVEKLQGDDSDDDTEDSVKKVDVKEEKKENVKKVRGE
ncbi:ribosomal L1 domain-containing protein CG13096 [Nasonia vitripennis]|uniref:Ribosomal protein L1 n=1 Tax=Nasonia vitripennis TaxID=7425 RepID=A0A7M7G4R5_NASVI|nr:ribosomal L1 domain-containing protein CG13096 [Nasonia vitripennis]